MITGIAPRGASGVDAGQLRVRLAASHQRETQEGGEPRNVLASRNTLAETESYHRHKDGEEHKQSLPETRAVETSLAGTVVEAFVENGR